MPILDMLLDAVDAKRRSQEFIHQCQPVSDKRRRSAPGSLKSTQGSRDGSFILWLYPVLLNHGSPNQGHLSQGGFLGLTQLMLNRLAQLFKANAKFHPL